MGLQPYLRRLLPLALIAGCAWSQVIEFESGGLTYQALTRNGLTIMVAELPSHVRDYTVLQVAVSNGSGSVHVIKPDDFLFIRSDGSELPSSGARTVVNSLVRRASRGDVIRLVTAYEAGIYGNSKYKATNGFEQRRQTALAEFVSSKVKAAAAASAIAFVATKLPPGSSTDGAVFYQNGGKPLGAGVIRVRAAGSVYEFPMLSSN